MKKPFKTLVGNRLYLELPKQNESGLILDEAAKIEVVKAEMEKLRRLKIYAVGTSASDIFKKGDEVMVDHQSLHRAPIIPLSDELSVLLINPFDVVHIW